MTAISPARSMTAISPAHGPIAVTGSSGYIGSWIVEDCVKQGYTVRACVRDKSNEAKVAHLLAMNNAGHRGKVEIFEADLGKEGSYDVPFAGCAGVVHAGAAVGFNQETPRKVYDGCFTEMKHLIESVKKSGSVKRFIFTSSCAAVIHPCEEGYIMSEKDWCGQNIEAYNGAWVPEMIDKNRDIAYSMAKAESERFIYTASDASDGSFECLSILPMHVIGPVMCKNHDQAYSWQNCIVRMMNGRNSPMGAEGRMLWNMVDVRDVARAHRLCLETPTVGNGSRFILAASDRDYEMFTWQLAGMLQRLFPQLPSVGGEPMESDGRPAKPTPDNYRAYSLLAKQLLGLETYGIEETVRATGDSYLKLGMIQSAEERAAAAARSAAKKAVAAKAKSKL